ncbi:heme exporter protein CcmB [Pedomonas mirosovicensis]|uniref:heme exporter protein CcmB n=1 Tax=Pedomonas mirosovicensis TaxID=2908641 RepID=UPI0021678623|nr:heme exporter protein CcmB [Pedomonas mirosovicensis]MCH8683785.1 heme exporter protein CcmB [Pedomonas mirosovicensis]
MSGGVFTLVRRELQLVWAERGGGAIALIFFVIVASLFPFAVGPEPQVLLRIASGIIWVSALLACLLSLERLFQPDAEDGTLEQLVVSGQSLEAVAIAKLIAHWLTTALPLVMLTPITAAMLGAPVDLWGALLLGLVLGTPALSAIGAVAAALTVGVRRGGVLISLLVLPLAVPTLIFGVGVADPLAGASALRWLAATTLLALAVSPFAAAAGLRAAME